MREVRICIAQRHRLTHDEAADLIGPYNADDAKVVRDIAEWQQERYNNPLNVEAFCKLPPDTIINIVIQMLWERKMLGYPWKPRTPNPGKRIVITKQMNIWIKKPPKPSRGKFGSPGWEGQYT